VSVAGAREGWRIDLDALAAAVNGGPAHLRLHTEQPDRSGADARRDPTHRRDRGETRRVDPLGRGLSAARSSTRRRARRSPGAASASSSPAGSRRCTGSPACASAGSLPGAGGAGPFDSGLHDDRTATLSEALAEVALERRDELIKRRALHPLESAGHAGGWGPPTARAHWTPTPGRRICFFSYRSDRVDGPGRQLIASTDHVVPASTSGRAAPARRLTGWSPDPARRLAAIDRSSHARGLSRGAYCLLAHQSNTRSVLSDDHRQLCSRSSHSSAGPHARLGRWSKAPLAAIAVICLALVRAVSLKM